MIPARWGMFRQYDAKTAHYLPSSVLQNKQKPFDYKGRNEKTFTRRGDAIGKHTYIVGN